MIVIGVPPLRERREDVPDLCVALLDRICHESGFETRKLGSAALAQLALHPFNGNVRELENMLHRAVALSDDGELDMEIAAVESADLPTNTPVTDIAVPENLQDYLDTHERSILCQVLRETRFNRTAAAAQLGLTLRQIRYRIARLNIALPEGDVTADIADSAKGPIERA